MLFLSPDFYFIHIAMPVWKGIFLKRKGNKSTLLEPNMTVIIHTNFFNSFFAHVDIFLYVVLIPV